MRSRSGVGLVVAVGLALGGAARAVGQEREGDPRPFFLGESALDLVYTPVTPCRIIDTRPPGAGGALAPGAPRDFHVAGTAGFDTQGGNAGGCGIALAAIEPGNQHDRIALTYAFHFLGAGLVRSGQTEEGLERLRQARRSAEVTVRADPGSVVPSARPWPRTRRKVRRRLEEESGGRFSQKEDCSSRLRHSRRLS
jgi:hypothetical protein